MAEKRLTWYRWEWQDPIQHDRWTACTVSVYAPTYERCYVSVLTSIANGHGRVLFRSRTLEEARSKVVIPEEAMERLYLAITKAEGILVEIQKDLKLIADSRALQPGTKLVVVNTGEVLAEAEQILKEKR